MRTGRKQWRLLAPLCSARVRLFGSFKKTYHLSGSGTKTVTRMSQPCLPFAIETDVPVNMGGSNVAPQPVELFLASLCGCELVTSQFIARNMKPRVTIDKIEFDVRAERDQRGAVGLPMSEETALPPSRLERIWGTAVVHTSSSQEDVNIIGQEVKRRCPIANMVVLSGCKLDIDFKKYEEGD